MEAFTTTFWMNPFGAGPLLRLFDRSRIQADQSSDIRGLIAIRVLVARNKVEVSATLVLPSPKIRRKTWDLRTRATTAPLFDVNGTGEEPDPMKRKSPRSYDSALGCVLLWIAVVRPDRRTAMECIRAAIAERDGKAQLP